ncbi:MAG: LPS export ABC transporter periplasmic protein LptC [Acidobacteriales bacterium]|nr:LPS export ABC transporter periplasmic protein LptC [Terriglobales bacterium]
MTARRWQWVFGAVAVSLIAVALGAYSLVRVRSRRTAAPEIATLPSDIAQRAVGFSYSKSEQGRTLFTVKAKEIIQFKDGVHAELKGASITVFGRAGDRYDEIYADKFSYNRSTQEIRADGPVEIDLEANPQGAAKKGDQRPPEEVRNPIHLKTSGLVFSQITGIAETNKTVEVQSGPGSGSALGAMYDTHTGIVQFRHDVRLTSGANTLTAASALVQQNPQRTVTLQQAVLRSSAREVSAPEMIAVVRQDNTVERIQAPHGLRVESTGEKALTVSSKSGVLSLSGKQRLEQAELQGDVHIASASATTEAQRATLRFQDDQLRSIDLSGSARVTQTNGSEIKSEELHAEFAGKGTIRAAHSDVPTSLRLIQPKTQRETKVHANKMQAFFDPSGTIHAVHASDNVSTVTQQPEAPVRATNCDALDAKFAARNSAAILTQIVELGHVKITEGERTATAARADYDASTGTAVLSGEPRVTEADASIAAIKISIDGDRRANAEGQVRLTYFKQASGQQTVKPAEVTHAVADAALLVGQIVTLKGRPVRLWQGGDVVTGSQVDFDRVRQIMRVQGTESIPATAEFVQAGGAIIVTSRQLTYEQGQGRAEFAGAVKARGTEGSITSDKMEVAMQRNQVQQITAIGSVNLRQAGRSGVGDKLVYDSRNESYRLTGSGDARPSIFDAELGTITGDSLTWYRHDDRVLVESQGNRTLTRTYVDANSRNRGHW